jgi:hypothetical protein
MARSHTDINMLLRSLVFSRLAEENAPSIHYEINVHSYDKAYYLADAIYPLWPRFMKMIHSLLEEKYWRFEKKQEAYRNGVEQLFGMLQFRWAIVWRNVRTCSAQQM